MKKTIYTKPRLRRIATAQESPLLAASGTTSASFTATPESLAGGSSIDFS